MANYLNAIFNLKLKYDTIKIDTLYFLESFVFTLNLMPATCFKTVACLPVLALMADGWSHAEADKSVAAGWPV